MNLNRSWSKQNLDLGYGKFIPMNACQRWPKNYMSYPYVSPWRNPDITQLASIAKGLGDCLKIIVMLRNPKEVIASDVKRFARPESQLVESTKVLAEQLSQIPREMIRCQDYASIHDGDHTLTTFLQIDNFDVESTWNADFKEHHGCAASQKGCPAAPALEKAQEDLARRFCGDNA